MGTPSERPTLPHAGSPESAVDARLGPYRITGELGAGGMGVVLSVHDAALGRDMAAKVALDEHREAALAKFVREAQITGQLEHPAIPPVHALARTPEGRTYFTMKKVEGRDLARLLGEMGQGPLARTRPPDPTTQTELLEIFLKVCDAVAFAHSRGVLHRDIKPSNVMVGMFGEVLVMDWGLARLLGEHDDVADVTGADSPTGPQATRDGVVLGTPAYMPPEQARGEVSRLDVRSDVYALGALLYEMLTLEPPFSGASSAVVLNRVLKGPPPTPRERAPHRAVPWELEAVVLRAMARQMDDRYDDVGALRADIVAYLEGRRVGAARYGLVAAARTWARAHRHALGAAALAVFAATAALSWTHWQRGRAVASLLEQAATWCGEGRGEAALEAIDRALALTPGHPGATLARAELVRAEVDRALQGLPGPAALETAWRTHLASLEGGEPERHETPDQQAERERTVAGYVRAAAWIDRAPFTADPELARRRLQAREGLAWAALLGRDYTFVQQATSLLATRGADEAARARVLSTALDADRQARVALWCRRVRVAADDLAQSLGRAGRPPGAPLRDDYLFELSAYRHPAVASELGRLLDLVLARQASADASGAQAERDLTHVLLQALGRLQLPESVPPLARYLDAMADPGQAVEAGLALCNTRRPEAQEPLLRARKRWGMNSDTWRQIASFFPRVPEPAKGPESDTTAREHHARGLLLMERKDPEGAIRELDRAIALNPALASAYNNRGLARRSLGDLDGAIRDFGQAIATDPLHAPAYVNRGTAFLDRGDLDDALRDCNQALELDFRNAVALNNRGLVRHVRGDHDGAIEDYDLALTYDPRYAPGYSNRGNAYRARGDQAAAIRNYDQALAIDPRFTGALASRGAVRRERGELDGAIQDLDQAIEYDPRAVDAFYQRALAREARGDRVGAIEDLGRVIALEPKSPSAFRRRAALRAARGDQDGAIQDYDQVLTLVADDVDALNGRGSAHKELGDLDRALLDFERALACDPRSAAALVNRGIVRAMRGDLVSARGDFDRAIELDPRCVLAYFNRGFARASSEDFEGALADYDRALELDPTNVGALVNRSSARLACRRFEESLADADRALELGAAQWEAWGNRGLALAALSRREEAVAALSRALELAPAVARPQVEAALRRVRGR